MPFFFVRLATRRAVDAAEADRRAARYRFSSATGFRTLPIFIFTTETGTPEATCYSRMFAGGFGITEDPATGGASGPLGCVSRASRRADAGARQEPREPAGPQDGTTELDPHRHRDDAPAQSIACASAAEVGPGRRRDSAVRLEWRRPCASPRRAAGRLLDGNDSPTDPDASPDPATGPIVYAAVAASDALGIGSSMPCLPLTECPNGMGLRPVIARTLRATADRDAYQPRDSRRRAEPAHPEPRPAVRPHHLGQFPGGDAALRRRATRRS